MKPTHSPDTDAAMFCAEVGTVDMRLLGIMSTKAQCVLATRAAVIEYQRDCARLALRTLLDFLDDNDTEAGMTWKPSDRQRFFDLAGFADA